MPYPFTPKSTAYMKAGQFWPIPLSNGRFACGRVLQIAREHGQSSTKMFLAGLMDWSGSEEPVSNDLEGIRILRSGSAHIKTITHIGAEIVGIRDLKADGLTVPFTLDQARGPSRHLTQGYDVLRLATHEEQSTLSVFSTWGFGVICLLAEHHFATN